MVLLETKDHVQKNLVIQTNLKSLCTVLFYLLYDILSRKCKTKVGAYQGLEGWRGKQNIEGFHGSETFWMILLWLNKKKPTRCIKARESPKIKAEL